MNLAVATDVFSRHHLPENVTFPSRSEERERPIRTDYHRPGSENPEPHYPTEQEQRGVGHGHRKNRQADNRCDSKH